MTFAIVLNLLKIGSLYAMFFFSLITGALK